MARNLNKYVVGGNDVTRHSRNNRNFIKDLGKYVAVGLALTGTIASYSNSARAQSAQSVCGDRNTFLEKLNSRYGEGITGMGLANNGTMLEIATSQQGSWTIIVTRPDGVSCVVATGEAWERLPLTNCKKTRGINISLQ
jgi:hypothetical protein